MIFFALLEIVRCMERSQPPSPNLLSDPKESTILEGVWYLHYTSPSDPSLIDAGESDKFPDAWKPQNVEEQTRRGRPSLGAPLRYLLLDLKKKLS